MARTKPPSRTKLHSLSRETAVPPDALLPTQAIARIVSNDGRNLYTVSLPGGKTLRAELDPKFVNTVWMKRGGFVLVQIRDDAAEGGKIPADIVNVVREERAWRKMPWWPKEFPKSSLADDDDGPQMPPSDSEEEDDDNDNDNDKNNKALEEHGA